LCTHYILWDSSVNAQEMPKEYLEIVFFVPIALFASLAIIFSGVSHFIIILYNKRYINDLKKGMNKFRWYEYCVTSSIMIGRK